jgi:ornithine cyclodeaminase
MAGAARIVVETHEAAWQEAGDLLTAEAEGYLDRTCTIDLASILDAPTPPPPDGYTIYKSVGAAWQDLACAAALDVILRRNDEGSDP